MDFQVPINSIEFNAIQRPLQNEDEEMHTKILSDLGIWEAPKRRQNSKGSLGPTDSSVCLRKCHKQNTPKTDHFWREIIHIIAHDLKLKYNIAKTVELEVQYRSIFRLHLPTRGRIVVKPETMHGTWLHMAHHGIQSTIHRPPSAVQIIMQASHAILLSSSIPSHTNAIDTTDILSFLSQCDGTRPSSLARH